MTTRSNTTTPKAKAEMDWSLEKNNTPRKFKPKAKAKMDWTLEKYNTPRKFKAMEPDLTVIVGGVKFFHYKAILLSTCEFFEKMLSSHMKEAESNIVEFPNRNPEEWLEVYKFLDPLNYGDKLGQHVFSFITKDNAEILLSWFDYLGMDEHLKLCDDKLYSQIVDSQEPPSYATWEQYKFTHTCPNARDAIIDATKFFAHKTAINASSKKEKVEDLKTFLFDDECGEEIWTYFTQNVVNLPKGMLEELDRDAIINSPLFVFMMETNARPQMRALANQVCARNLARTEAAARRTRKQQAEAAERARTRQANATADDRSLGSYSSRSARSLSRSRRSYSSRSRRSYGSRSRRSYGSRSRRSYGSRSRRSYNEEGSYDSDASSAPPVRRVEVPAPAPAPARARPSFLDSSSEEEDSD